MDLRTTRRLVVALCCLPMAACGPASDDPPASESWGHARGRVATVLPDGDAIALRGAVVEVYALDPRSEAEPDFHGSGPSTELLATAVTDETGRYSLEVPAGWATLRFVAPDHTASFRTARFWEDKAGAFDIELRPLPQPLEFTMPRPGDPDAILGFDSEAGRTYASLRVEPGDLVAEDGSAPQGPITAYVDAVHPRDNGKEGFAASMLVRTPDSSPEPFDPIALLAVDLFAGEQRVHVAPGQTLTWTTEVAAEQRDDAWAAWQRGDLKNHSLDTRTGLWVAEPADLHFDGTTLTVERPHFSHGGVGYGSDGDNPHQQDTEVGQQDPCADPGRHAVVLLTFSNPRTPEQVADTLIETTVEYVSQVEDPRVLVVLDDFHHDEFPEDAAFIASKVNELGYFVRVIDEPSNGITESHVEGYDVVWFLNPGYPIDDRASLETLAGFREAGGGFVLSGDDITLNYAGQADTSPFTFVEHLGNGTRTCGHTTDNNVGESYRITFESDTGHLLAAGLEGLSFLYGDDIDHSRPVGDGERVLAWAELDGFPSCDVRIPVVVALDLDDSEVRPSCSCDEDNDCEGEQQCLSNTCQHCGDEESSCESSDDCCGALACNDGTCGEPCGNAGDACEAAGTCCGQLSCFAQTCSQCIPEGGSCEGDGDCCGSVLCIDGTCNACHTTGEACSDAGDCCGSSLCQMRSETVEVDDEQCAGDRNLTAIVRDVSASHPDFEGTIGTDRGLVERDLGVDGKPVYAGGDGTLTTNGPDAFGSWFNDTAGVNQAIEVPLVLEELEDGVYQYRNNAFFPIDGRGLGDEGRDHNYHFTLELHSEFVYRGGELFTFTGDDDLFVFINGVLAIDLGGVHSQQSQTVDLDQAANLLGLEVGTRYPLDIFFAERHTVASNFRIDTTIGCLSTRRTEEVVIGSCAPPETEDPACRDNDAAFVGLEGVSLRGSAMVLGGSESGNVGSNADISLSSAAIVEGNANTAGGEVTVAEQASVEGEITQQGAGYQAPVPHDAFDRALYTNSNERIVDDLDEGALSLQHGESVHLEPGDYALTSLTLLDQSSVTCEGNVRLFVEGEVTLADDTVLGSPGTCELTVLTETTGTVQFSNRAQVATTLFAPLADVRLDDDARLEGSIVARALTLEGRTSAVAASDPFGVVCDPAEPDEPQDDTGGTSTGGDPEGETGDLPPLPDVPH